MILTNVFLSVFIILNSINIINFNDKSNKYQLSVEKSDVLKLNFDNLEMDLYNKIPNISDVIVKEVKPKVIVLSKNFNKNFDEFYEYINSRTKFLYDELDMLNQNSQAYNSEYLFQRKVHIKTELESLSDKIENMSLKQKKKLIYIEYENHNIDKYDGLLGFSIIYNDKDNPILLGTIVMPEYIGKLEVPLTIKSIDFYKSKYKVQNDNIYTEPLSYFDRYFLNSVGFK